jgi:hypothetical protein
VVRRDEPFAAIDYAELRSLFNLAKPGITLPSGHTVKRDIMKYFHELERRVGERLRNAPGRISVTVDAWTSPNTKAFLGITGHYIDDDCAMQSLTLDFVPMPEEHSGEHMCGAFVKACEQRGILDKLQGVTTDNASNMGAFLGCLEEACCERGIKFSKDEQHVRCVSHVMNLAVQEFLGMLKPQHSSANSDRGATTRTGTNSGRGVATQTGTSSGRGVTTQTESESCIAKLHDLVFWIHRSPGRSEWFKDLCNSCGISGKKVVLDVCTRWNSTYAMIQRACELKAPLSQLMKVADVPQLDSEEWVVLEVTSQVLSTFSFNPVYPV